MGRGASLPRPGDTTQADWFQEGPGGKGANQAVAAARLGARVALLACAGQDQRGSDLVAHLRNEGVGVHHIIRDAGAPTGVSIILVDSDGQKEIMYFAGANDRLSAPHIHRLADVVLNSRVLLTQLEIPLECAAAAIHVAHEAGVKVILDPAPAVSLPDELLRRVDILKPNAAEAQTITRLRVDDRSSARAAATRLLASGVGAVAVQAGHEGDLIVWDDGESWLPRLPVTSIDTTGAGDAFAAGLAVGLSEGMSWSDMGSFASITAGLSTMAFGAQAGLPRRDEVDAVLVGQNANINPVATRAVAA